MYSLQHTVRNLYLMLHDKKVQRNCTLKLKKLCNNQRLLNINLDIQRKYLSTWKSLKHTPSLLFLKCACSISGIESGLFVPEDIYYTTIEPALNHRLFALAYNDKNFFERYLHEYKEMFPKVLLRGIAGVFYNGHFTTVTQKEACNILTQLDPGGEYILKPSTETGGGDNVSLINVDVDRVIIDGKPMMYSELISILVKHYKMNFVLQERIEQSDWFSCFNSEATNIIRIYSYRSVLDNEIHVLHSYIRYAASSDNFQEYLRNGGYRCGIDKNGNLHRYSIGRYGDKFEDKKMGDISHNGNVPLYSEMVNAVKNIGSKFYHHRVLGFDFIVDRNDRVRVLEVNLRNIGMVHHQLIDGPLFGEFTDEVVTFCQTNEKSAAFNFYFR